MTEDHSFRRVTQGEPCVICGKPDWCRRSASGAHECHRINEPTGNGLRRVATTPAGFAVYRDPRDQDSSDPHTAAAARGKRPRVFDSPQAAAESFAQWKKGSIEKVYQWTADWYRARIQTPSGKTFCEITHDSTGWVLRGPPKPRPLYRIGELPSTGFIAVAEGEKACDAAWSIGLPCVTSGAADSARSADWSKLDGRDVAVFPDCDAAGARYADEVARQLKSLDASASVKVVHLPGLEDGEDLHDFINEHRDSRDAGDIRTEIRALIANTPDYAPAGDSKSERGAPDVRMIKPWHRFPVDAMPDPLRSFVRHGAQSLACDPALVALPALAVVGAAIGHSRRISLKRGTTGWSEPAVIWACPISESGTQKTPAFNLVIAPVLDIQRAALKAYQRELQEYAAALERFEKERSAWRRKKQAAGPPPKPPEKPVPQRFVVSDTTVEALAPIIEANPRGILLARDELAAWFGSFDKYSHGTGKSRGDAAQWESMHNASFVIVDRKTGDKRTIFIPHAAVSICGGIQPQTLRRALGLEHFESGLAQRFLFAMPPRKAKRWTDADIPDHVQVEFVNMIESLYGLSMNPAKDKDDDEKPVYVPLTVAAQQAWINFVNEHGERQLETSGDLAAAFSKLEAYAARFALIFHFVRWAVDDPTLESRDAVDAASVRSGIELSRWFCHETERVYAILQETEEERANRELIQWIERRGGSVAPRELQAGRREFRSSVEKARGALELLVNQGVGTWERPPPRPDGGRPSERFRLVNSVSVNETPAIDPNSGGSVGVDSADAHEEAFSSQNVQAVGDPKPDQTEVAP